MIFPRAEFERRVWALQARMAKQSCEALLLTSPADVFYVTGFLTRFWESPARPWFVIVPAEGAPVAVIPSIGQALMSQTWVEDICCWDAPDPVDDGVSLLSETLREVTAGTVGVPMGLETSLRMPLADYHRLADAGLAFVDATDIVQRVREIKSEAEIATIRATCAIADQAFDQVTEIIMKNPYLDQVFRRFQATLLAEGADWVAYTAGGAGQGGYGDVIAPATSARLKDGDVVMLDTGAVKDGYFCDFDRNYAIGTPSDRTRTAHAALYAATDHALAEIRPGMRASDVHALLASALAERGETPGAGRLGHGLGIALTEWPSFTPKDQTLLRENMVLTLEPSVVISPGRILVHEENIVLREAGAELLSTRAPAEMPEVRL